MALGFRHHSLHQPQTKSANKETGIPIPKIGSYLQGKLVLKTCPNLLHTNNINIVRVHIINHI